jgi:hypothetical protein
MFSPAMMAPTNIASGGAQMYGGRGMMAPPMMGGPPMGMMPPGMMGGRG